MAHAHPGAMAALHLNMVMIQAANAVPKAPDELAWAARRAKFAGEQTATRKCRVAVPRRSASVGVAAWIVEKFGAWADVPRDEPGRPDLWQTFNEDTLLTNIMLYPVDGALITSTWMYRGRVLEGSGEFPAGTRIEVPTGVAAFSDPVLPPPPRSHAEKTYRMFTVPRWQRVVISRLSSSPTSSWQICDGSSPIRNRQRATGGSTPPLA